MITTIQLHENVKKSLDRLRTDNESYEKIIVRMIDILEKKKRENNKLLIEGYKEMAEESLKIAKEFEAIEEDFDWEW